MVAMPVRQTTPCVRNVASEMVEAAGSAGEGTFGAGTEGVPAISSGYGTLYSGFAAGAVASGAWAGADAGTACCGAAAGAAGASSVA